MMKRNKTYKTVVSISLLFCGFAFGCDFTLREQHALGLSTEDRNRYELPTAELNIDTAMTLSGPADSERLQLAGKLSFLRELMVDVLENGVAVSADGDSAFGEQTVAQGTFTQTGDSGTNASHRVDNVRVGQSGSDLPESLRRYLPSGISRISGQFRIQRRCEIPSNSASLVTRAGSISLIVRFTEQGLESVVEGYAEDCFLSFQNKWVFIEGTFSADLGLDLGLGFSHALAHAPKIFRLQGRVRFDDQEMMSLGASGPVEFRICTDGGPGCHSRSFQIRASLTSGGEVILQRSLDETDFSIRAKNGIFRCTAEPSVCTRTDGLSVPMPTWLANFVR